MLFQPKRPELGTEPKSRPYLFGLGSGPFCPHPEPKKVAESIFSNYETRKIVTAENFCVKIVVCKSFQKNVT